MSKYLIYFLFCMNYFLIAQSNIEFSGYLQNMQTIWTPKSLAGLFPSKTILSNSISNRINVNYYHENNFAFNFGMRNIFDYGNLVSLIPGYSSIATIDNGYFDLTEKILSDNSFVLYSNIDRLNLFYSNNDWEVQIGRQRINLGVSYVWTPNDIFNSASFLNFDYVEKSGSDAIRIEKYFDYASSLQLVAKADNNKNITAAAVYKFNKWNYDFQSIIGFSEDDYIFGAGWTGNISGAGFYGEATYFDNRKYFDNVFLISIGGNYMFSNNLLVNAEVLYNSYGNKLKQINTLSIFNLEYSAKYLSRADYSIFFSAQYPITPLINTSLSAIINPNDGSMLINPYIEISLNESVYLLIAGQLFQGKKATEWGDYGKFYFMRIKWNF